MVPLAAYVTAVPRLTARYEGIKRLLSAAGTTDVTMVTCANREDIEALPAERRHCLHPEYTATRWSSKAMRMPNGTLSLSVKHILSYRDLLRRDLHAILVLEDDAKLPSSIWSQLSRYHLPCDADIFFVSASSPT